MNDFKLNIQSDNIFIINLTEIEKRLDPNPYHKERLAELEKLEKLNCKKLKSVVIASKSQTNLIEENDIYIGLENIKSDTGEYIKTSDKETISSANIFKSGQILFPKLRPYLNKVFLADFDGICSTEFHVFNAKDINPEYLAIFLRSSIVVNQTKHLMTGNTLPRLQTDDINNIPVPIISDELQRQIVDLYNNAFQKKQQKEAQAQELLKRIDTYLLNELGITLPVKDNALENRIFTSSLSQVSGGRFDSSFHSSYNRELLKCINAGNYELQPIKNNAVFVPGYAFSSSDYLQESDCYLITIKNISKNEIKLNNVTFLPSNYFDLYKQYRINEGDLLIAMTGATIGKVGIYNNSDKALLNQRNGIIRPTDNLNTQYILSLLNTSLYQELILKNSVGGAQPNISETDITKIKIPIPPLDKQTEIDNHITTIRNQAKQLENEATQIMEKAKVEVEKIILGE